MDDHIAQKQPPRYIEFSSRFSYPRVMEIGGDNSWLYQDPIADIHALKRRLIYAGSDIIDLSMINPDILPATSVIDKLHEHSIKAFNHRYAVSRGVRKLREAFSDKYQKRFGITVDPELEICVSSGTKDAIIHVLHTLTRPGDTIVIGAPTYPVYLSAAHLSRLNTAFFEIDRDEAVMLTNIETTLDRTNAKVLLINFPNNPTGNVVSRSFYESLAKLTRERDVTVINDFVYGEMGYVEDTISLLSVRNINPHLIETYSLSKAYSVPGWRVGAILGEAGLVRNIARLKSHSDYGLFLPIQLASAAILSGKQDVVGPILSQYRKRMKSVVAALHAMDWEIVEPSAGASVWVKLPNHLSSGGAKQFCRTFLERFQVLLTPGELYGTAYNTHIRFALVCSEERLDEVLSRLKQFSSS